MYACAIVKLRVGKAGRVWDLRLLRERLAEMGLDWDAPPFLPADKNHKHTAPVRVEIDLGELQ